MEKITWTCRVRNEELLQKMKEERIILKTIKKEVQPEWAHFAYELPSGTHY
jgi:hypothetical protein